MKLDVKNLRYLSKDEFRVLQAIEIGQRNHEIVPVPLIDTIAGLKHGGAVRSLKTLLRGKLVHHDGSKYDGYRLTNMGYDFLALRALMARGSIAAVGSQIGVGKESDVFEVLSPHGERMALKLHRLGRTSFRAVKAKRDYLRHRTSFSWLYLSRLAALKEFAFMKALGERGFPVPVAVDHSRHAVLMSMAPGVPLSQVRELQDPVSVYRQCMDLMTRLAAQGLVHCDFNEFNLLIDEEERLVLIDFPQMVSSSHANAEHLFQRDAECVNRFFEKKIGLTDGLQEVMAECFPHFQDVILGAQNLDVQLAASGFQHKHQAALDDAHLDAETGSSSSEGASDPDEAAVQHQHRADASSAASDGSSSSGLGTEDRPGDADQGGDHSDLAPRAELCSHSQNVPRPGRRRPHPHDSADSGVCSLSDSGSGSLCGDSDADPSGPSDHWGLSASAQHTGAERHSAPEDAAAACSAPHSCEVRAGQDGLGFATQEQLQSHAHEPGLPHAEPSIVPSPSEHDVHGANEGEAEVPGQVLPSQQSVRDRLLLERRGGTRRRAEAGAAKGARRQAKQKGRRQAAAAAAY